MHSSPCIVPLLKNGTLWGWGSRAPVFRTLIELVNPKVILEIESFLGASALHMAEVTRSLNFDTVTICLDDFR
jgi:hypothetical protein